MYWYVGGAAKGNPSGTGTASPPNYPYPPASEFTETPWGSPNTSVKGIKGDLNFGSFSGSGTIGTDEFIEAFYFTDAYCTDGGNEYGFDRYAVGYSNLIKFYWGTRENCTVGSTVYCFSNSNGTGPDGTTADGVDISGLGNNSHSTSEWLYEAWISADAGALYGYSLSFAIIDPFNGSYAQCSLNGGATGNCTWSGLGSQQNWFRPDLLYNSSGWVVAGTVAAGNPSVTTGFSVTAAYVGH
jgi:hypothetical protein